MRLLLVSNGMDETAGYLGHARHQIDTLLGDAARLAYVPYAAVVRTYDEWTEFVQSALGSDRELVGVHSVNDPVSLVAGADGVVVSGGNTSRLLRGLRDAELIEPIRTAVRSGTPYVGWSAGANVACPTISTTNDMPIVDPRGLRALDLIPFQINPHYLDGVPNGFQGESREGRIREFLHLNSGVTVTGLREGTMLAVDGDEIRLHGAAPCRVFEVVDGDVTSRDIDAESDLSALMRRRVEHDSAQGRSR